MNAMFRFVAPLGLSTLFLLATACGDADDAFDVDDDYDGVASALVKTCGEASTVALLAGQAIPAGSVEIRNDEQNLFVTFTTTDGFSLVNTHVAVASSRSGLPHNRGGNLVPGQFPYSADHEAGTTSYSFSIALGDLVPGDSIFIAAHASLVKLVDGEVVQSETGWGQGPRFSNKNWATYFGYTIQECTVEEQPLQGCTIGYWRQAHHFDSYVGYKPSDSLSAIVKRPVPGSPSLSEAIVYTGGGINNLIRQSAAALLNAAHPDVNYAFTTSEVIAAFQAAFDSGDYEATALAFDRENRRGCPLN